MQQVLRTLRERHTRASGGLRIAPDVARVNEVPRRELAAPHKSHLVPMVQYSAVQGLNVMRATALVLTTVRGITSPELSADPLRAVERVGVPLGMSLCLPLPLHPLR